jgi:hypothetical protein
VFLGGNINQLEGGKLNFIINKVVILVFNNLEI